MFRNNLKIALRSLTKRKGFTLINALGLSIGLASCMIIVLFVKHHYSYDTFFKDSDRIYRMVEQRISPEENAIHGYAPYSFVSIVSTLYPEVESATAISGPYSNQNVSVLDEKGQLSNFLESHVLIADRHFFNVLSFEMISGDKNTALTNPNSVVLSESTAQRFFGDENAIGKSIVIGRRSAIVTGVCKDAPANSHFKFTYIVSSTSFAWMSQDTFNLRYAQCYFKLKPTADVKSLEDKFPEMVETYVAGEIERINNVSWEDHKKAGNQFNYYLRPLTSVHLDTEIASGMKPGGNPTMLKVLIGVAVLIFLIATVNFMNLATVRSMERAREVGLRKVMGSQKSQLVVQFLIESFLIIFMGVFLAVLIVALLLPLFNEIFNTPLFISFSIHNFLGFFGLTLFISVLAGLYPAIKLSRFKPVQALKGTFTTRTKDKWIKNGLVGFQCWISMLLIICTLIFQKQVHFLKNKDLGFDKEQLLVVEGTFHMDANYTQPFLEEARSTPGVIETAGTLWVPGFNGTWSDEYTVEGANKVHSLRRVPIGDQLAETMGYQLMAGSFFSEQTNDERNVLLNQAAVDALNLENPVGETLSMLTHDEGSLEKTNFKIKGVIKNFNYQSLRNEVEPLVFQSNETVFGRMSYIVIRLNGKNIGKTIEALEKKWRRAISDRAFTYRFLDDTLDANYRNEQNLATLFSLFSGLSIIIAGTGLLVLSAYSTRLRTKEIGIRKIIGASVQSILLLLSKDFIKIVGAAFLLASPFAWLAMDRWLQDFTYRITMSADIFILAGIAGIISCWMAIGTQAMKAALSNPVKSLKGE